MTDKKNRGSIPPPPPPPPPLAKQSHLAGPASSSPTTVNGEVMTNGSASPSAASKPKPPSKPSKLTRAFSSGTLPSFSKLRKNKSKTAAVTTPVNGTTPDAVTTTNDTRNETGTKENGNGNDVTPPRVKLPGLGTALMKSPRRSSASVSSTNKPKIPSKPNPLPNAATTVTTRASSAQATSVSGAGGGKDAAIVERELPPIPVPETSEISLENRKLPPLPPDEEGDRDSVGLSSTPQEQNTTLPNGDTSPVVPASTNTSTCSDSQADINKSSSMTPPPDLPPHYDDETIKSLNLESTEKDQEKAEDEGGKESVSAREEESKDSTVLVSDSTHEDKKSDTEASSSAKENDTSSELTTSTSYDKDSSSSTLSLTNQSASQTSLPTNETATAALAVAEEGQDVTTEKKEGQEEQSQQQVLQDYTIGEIIDTYSYALPVRVRVLQGYCSDTSEVNISTDDVYDIHSIHHTRKVIMRDQDGMVHRLSPTAPVKIGLIFDPKNGYDESLNGLEFKAVSEIVSLPLMPKLVCAKQTYSSGEERNSVSEGEILVVNGIHRSVFKGKKGLKVFSLLTKSNKVLLDDCQTSFTTKPSLVRMDLPDLLESVEGIFPSRAVIYPTTNDTSLSSEFPGTLSRVVTLMECSTETSLIVSDISYMDESALEEANLIPIPKESQNSLDLLLDDDISQLEVAVLKWTYPEDYPEEEDVAEAVDDDDELNHVYDDTTILQDSEEFSTQGRLTGSTSFHSQSQGSVRMDAVSMTSGSSGQREDEHMYVNLQQAQLEDAAGQGGGAGGGGGVGLSSERLVEKEKTFMEEDEDAGYDTVGLHLLRNGSTSNSGFPPAPTDGYSTVSPTLATKMAANKPSPPNNGYSSIFRSSSKGAVTTTAAAASKKPPNNGYSTVSIHRTVNGVVVAGEEEEESLGRGRTGEGNAGGVAGLGGGAGGIVEGGGSNMEQLSLMMESMKSKMVSPHQGLPQQQQQQQMAQMQNMMEMLAKTLESVNSQLIKPSPKTEAAADGSNMAANPVSDRRGGGGAKSAEEENKEYLSSLSAEQVGELMESMGLRAYKQKIVAEHISGEILLECDDSVLKEEIGITSKIHRIRIMKIISGQHSAKALLEKDS